MTDAYLPALSELKFTAQEADAIKAALSLPKPWGVDNEHIKNVKNKIREHHLERHGQTCCYCRIILQGSGHFMIDREHILPKGNAKYKILCYEPWNLSSSCKRCNMEIKGEDDNFVIDKTDASKLKLSSNYLFVHPNFDEWEKHLTREAHQISRFVFVKYAIIDNSTKGQYTYEYFKLKDLEIESLNAAQGIKNPAPDPSEGAIEARAIAEAFGQL
ncbi:hypothetical protein RYH74_08290 [Pseudomonas sp. LSJ-87]|uniref:HNH endonuclease n=1 Tax=Pseudomonas sp. LSJ-87 TaxID=3079932 RepID=UPI0029417F7C|nr:hypothetical protein [Pseudomonas sp. LSJ-87]MDV5097286.1 hypothetical protein [Pseudomonas sp. LSJ-87]